MSNVLIPVQSAPGAPTTMTTLIPGTNITVTYSSAANTITFDASGGGGATLGSLYPIMVAAFSN